MWFDVTNRDYTCIYTLRCETKYLCTKNTKFRQPKVIVIKLTPKMYKCLNPHSGTILNS